MLVAAALLALVVLASFLTWRSRSSNDKDKGHVSDSWLAANRASNRTTE
jgi:hypothetical protein